MVSSSKMSSSDVPSEVLNTNTEADQHDLAQNVVVESSIQPKVGDYIGQCKWWADKLGYGFLTIQSGAEKGKDIFVHHSGIRPLNSNYKTLKKGEYVNFDIVDGNHGQQAVNVTGIGGGSLICDVNPYIRAAVGSPSQPQQDSPQAFVKKDNTGTNPNRYRQRITTPTSAS